VGMALGLLAATLVTRSRGLSLTGPVIAGLSGGIAFYLAYDIEALLDWPLWAVALAFWGGFEIVRPPKAK